MAHAQSFGDATPQFHLPSIQPYAPPTIEAPLATIGSGQLSVSAHLTEDAPALDRGLVWRIFKPEPGPDGRLPLVASAQGGTGVFDLEPGSYLVHASFGRAGATKRIRLGNGVVNESLVLEAGKLTEAMVEHKAAEVTLKLVREAGGEAIADTSWSILTESGDIVRESVGAFASMVLAEGNYAVVAKNRDRLYQREFTVEAGRNRDVEVLAAEAEN